MNIKAYSNERLEFFGDELNRRFNPSRLECVGSLDVYDVVDFIGCTPEWKYITPDQSILGMTVFEKTEYYVWREPKYEKGCLPIKTTLEKGTILIDRTLNEGNKQKQCVENFTVIHECFHWLLHKDYFENTENSIQCCSEDTLFGKFFSLNAEIATLEHQANRCAACFLMPKNAVSSEFMKNARMQNKPYSPLPEREMKKYIAQTANQFGVNFNPMKYRLQELGFIQKQGENYGMDKRSHTNVYGCC